ncbi:hypothetical protein [Kineococcus arenarius]|uniref:hypothetical protein n=1 Tax=Kineococcus sp. SYSU DK007 TaxID=3383128 RepID=UPI003D7D9C00
MTTSRSSFREVVRPGTMVIVGRVHLNAGGKGPQEIRMGSRGASERLRPPGDDISPVRTAGREGARVCDVCRSTRGVTVRSGEALCASCRDDRKLVTEVRRLCRRESLPPIGVPVTKGSPYEKLRRDAAAASERLKAKKPAGPKARGRTTAAARSTARVFAGADPAGVRSLQARKKALARRLQEQLTPEERRRARTEFNAVMQVLTALDSR